MSKRVRLLVLSGGIVAALAAGDNGWLGIGLIMVTIGIVVGASTELHARRALEERLDELEALVRTERRQRLAELRGETEAAAAPHAPPVAAQPPRGQPVPVASPVARATESASIPAAPAAGADRIPIRSEATAAEGQPAEAPLPAAPAGSAIPPDALRGQAPPAQMPAAAFEMRAPAAAPRPAMHWPGAPVEETPFGTGSLEAPIQAKGSETFAAPEPPAEAPLLPTPVETRAGEMAGASVMEQAPPSVADRIESAVSHEDSASPEAAAASAQQPAPSPTITEARPEAVRPPAAPPAQRPPLVAREQTPPPPRASLLDIEQILGVNWLSKVGVAILVIGVSFFLAWQLRQLGPLGKDVVGATVGLALLGAGIWAERSERYRILGRATLGGGWALLFFVSYAAHYVKAARVIDSPAAGTFLMLVVAAAMVAHTLRYRSQVVTGLAFLLAFLTVAISRAGVASLSANVILAIGFSFIVVRMRWFPLELAGLAAIYLNHWLWLRPIIGPMEGNVRPFPEFQTSAAILILYWLVFRVSFVLRRAPDETISAASAILNTALYLVVSKYQSTRPELAFTVLLVLGIAEIAAARIVRARDRRTSFVVLTVVGAGLIGAAIPFRFAPGTVTPVWLVDAIVFTAAGLLTNERVYRRLGTLLAAATAVQFTAFPVARLYVARSHAESAAGDWTLGTIGLAVVIVLYAEALWLPRKWPALFGEDVDKEAARCMSYIGALAAVLAGWVLFPGNGAAVFFAAFAVLLMVAQRRWRFETHDLTIQALLIAAVAVVRAIVVNVLDQPAVSSGGAHLPWRLASVVVVAALLYALSQWSAVSDAAIEAVRRTGTRWAATLLLVLLAWAEVRAVAVVLAWTALALALAAAGRFLRIPDFAVQANAVAALAVVRLLAINLPDGSPAFREPFLLTWRAIAFVTVSALLYLLSHWNKAELSDLTGHFAIPLWTASGLLTLLLWCEIVSTAIAIAWTALAFAFALSGQRFTIPHLTAQANALAIVIVAHATSIDLPSPAVAFSSPLPITWRLLSVTFLAVLLYALSRWNRIGRFETHPSFWIVPRAVGTALVVSLLWVELIAPAVLFGWTLLGFILLVAARRFRLADLSLQANALAAGAIARSIITNLPSKAPVVESLPLSWRLLSVPLLAVLLYALSKWSSVGLVFQEGVAANETATERENRRFAENVLGRGPMWAGTALLLLFAWYELLPASVALAWAVAAVILLDLGIRRASWDLMLQAYYTLVLVFGRVFIVNMNIDEGSAFGARMTTVVPVAITLLYAYARADASREETWAPRWPVSMFAWFGMAVVTALLRFELSADQVVVGWAGLTLFAVAIAAFTSHRAFLHIGIAVAFLTLARGAIHNLYERSYFPSPNDYERWLLVGIATALLAGSLPFAFRARRLDVTVGGAWVKRGLRWMDARPEQILFYIPLVLLTALIGTEMRSGMLTVGWGLEAVAVFVVAMLVRERSYRLTGVALLLLCVAKVLVIDFWSLNLRDKAITGIILGLALIGVSFLYTHKRDAIRQWL